MLMNNGTVQYKYNILVLVTSTVQVQTVLGK